LTNADFEVKGTTAVAMPTSIKPIAKASSSPLVYVQPTDISLVAETQSEAPVSVEPEQMGLVPVAPVVVKSSSVPPISVADTAPAANITRVSTLNQPVASTNNLSKETNASVFTNNTKLVVANTTWIPVIPSSIPAV
jgi:hypothetical protein